MEPMKATSNQKAKPCTRPECSMWNLKGISILDNLPFCFIIFEVKLKMT